MKYLVCTPSNKVCKLKVVADGNVDQPFEVWALNTGGRVLFVEKGLGKLLDRFHIGGSFDNGALYGIEYDEMVLILEAKLGPHDRHRYETSMMEFEALQQKCVKSKWPAMAMASAISWGTLKLICVVFARTLVMIVWLIMIPIFIGIVKSIGNRR